MMILIPLGFELFTLQNNYILLNLQGCCTIVQKYVAAIIKSYVTDKPEFVANTYTRLPGDGDKS